MQSGKPIIAPSTEAKKTPEVKKTTLSSPTAVPFYVLVVEDGESNRPFVYKEINKLQFSSSQQVNVVKDNKNTQETQKISYNKVVFVGPSTDAKLPSFCSSEKGPYHYSQNGAELCRHIIESKDPHPNLIIMDNTLLGPILGLKLAYLFDLTNEELNKEIEAFNQNDKVFTKLMIKDDIDSLKEISVDYVDFLQKLIEKQTKRISEQKPLQILLFTDKKERFEFLPEFVLDRLNKSQKVNWIIEKQSANLPAAIKENKNNILTIETASARKVGPGLRKLDTRRVTGRGTPRPNSETPTVSKKIVFERKSSLPEGRIPLSERTSLPPISIEPLNLIDSSNGLAHLRIPGSTSTTSLIESEPSTSNSSLPTPTPMTMEWRSESVGGSSLIEGFVDSFTIPAIPQGQSLLTPSSVQSTPSDKSPDKSQSEMVPPVSLVRSPSSEIGGGLSDLNLQPPSPVKSPLIEHSLIGTNANKKRKGSPEKELDATRLGLK
jgi:hypothetical protein